MKTIYCIKNDKNKVIYVGQTINLKRRMYEHRYRKKLPKSYTFVEICKCNEKEANEIEKYYIDFYKTIENGYNKVHGIGSEGIKENKGRFKKNNEIWKKRKTKKVYCFENGKIYNSAKDCAKELNIKNHYKINDVCSGNRKSYKKYHFKYIE